MDREISCLDLEEISASLEKAVAEANERLKKAGVEVSEPGNGRRPGTQLFTVQSHTANVPTIVIGGLEHWS